MTTARAWANAQTSCATKVAQLYADSKVKDAPEMALKLTVEAWTEAMQKLNPHGVSRVASKLGGRTLTELTMDDKLGLTFAKPHPSLSEFAQAVRFAAAAAQSVA